MSNFKESQELFFPLEFYNEIVYKHFIFDLPKLFDLAAMYGNSNALVVRTLIGNVFENDKRYITDFKTTVDTLITCFKGLFRASL